MAFIYLPTVCVQPYKVFGVTLFAVESVGVDYGTFEAYQIQHMWFGHPVIAEQYAESMRQGGEA